jgi:hypothetical protein
MQPAKKFTKSKEKVQLKTKSATKKIKSFKKIMRMKTLIMMLKDGS